MLKKLSMKILKARYKSGQEFLDALDKEDPAGELFCPVTTPLDEGQRVVVEVHFPQLPNKMLVRGSVVWWRAALPRLRVRAGAQVSFDSGDMESLDFIKDLAGGEAVDAVRRRHPRIPVTLDVQCRKADSADLFEGKLRDISIGGSLLITEYEVDAGDDLIIELTTPGGAHPMDIAAKVTHCGAEGAGVRFIYRDGGGSQRLREVVRRLIDKG